MGYRHQVAILPSLHLPAKYGSLKFRFDVTNVFDQSYELRNGTGIGVFAPQFGSRRGFFGGMSWVFDRITGPGVLTLS